MHYAAYLSKKETPQSEQIPLSNQIPNNSGGWVYEVNKYTQLQRFLLLGTCGGSYYVDEKELTLENAKIVIECIQENGPFVLGIVHGVSESGRAHKNEPAIFALVLAMQYGNQDTKNMAYKLIFKVCRTGTHLFTFCQYIQEIRGWSAGLRKGVASFYIERENEKLTTQLIKYRQRNGWTHKDVLRLCHAKPKNEEQNNLFKWVLEKENCVKNEYIQAFEIVQKEDTSFKDVLTLITNHKFSWEMLPTHLLNKKEIWAVLLPNLGMTALIRNLAKMTSIGFLSSNLEGSVQFIVQKLKDENELKKSRIHPMSILLAMKTYANGKGFKGSLSWVPVQAILDALDEAFYKTFSNVQPSNKRFLVGLDVSGSMDSTIDGTNISNREAACAMSMILCNTEPKVDMMAFSSEFIPLTWGKKTRLDDVCKKTQQLDFSSTDCSLPMLYALERRIEVDVFVVFTDNETNHGRIHPSQALKKYRREMNLPKTKLIVCAMESSRSSIADPLDGGMLDCVGLDANLPVVINQFAADQI